MISIKWRDREHIRMFSYVPFSHSRLYLKKKKKAESLCFDHSGEAMHTFLFKLHELPQALQARRRFLPKDAS